MLANSFSRSRIRDLVRAAVLLLALLAACGDGPPTEQTIVSDSAGIRVVSNLGADTPLEWTFTPTLTLGGEQNGPESFYSVSERTVGVDADGRIYVLDADGHRLIVFAGDGSHLRTLGREGKGPGEISWPFGLTVKPDGTALIDDVGRGSVHGYDSEGTPLNAVEELVPNNRRVWGTEGYYSALSTTEDEHMLYQFFRVLGSDTTELARHTSPATGVVELESCGMSLSGMSLLFSSNIVWDAWRARAAAIVGTAYQIETFDGSAHVASYRREIEPRRATRDLAVREVGDGMRMVSAAGIRECSADEVVEKRGFAELVPAIRAVRVGPDGRIWVSRGGPRSEPTPTDVLAADGTYIGTLPADAPFPMGFLPDGRVLASERDELDVARLVVYRIDQVPPG